LWIFNFFIAVATNLNVVPHFFLTQVHDDVRRYHYFNIELGTESIQHSQVVRNDTAVLLVRTGLHTITSVVDEVVRVEKLRLGLAARSLCIQAFSRCKDEPPHNILVFLGALQARTHSLVGRRTVF